jgi:hypothetical protein
MPLTLTASWPSLVDGKKAKASEVESKFSWLEGDILPMVGGEFTTGVYNIGSPAYQWDSAYFSDNLVIGGNTITSSMVGMGIKGWINLEVAFSVTTEYASYNVASYAILTAGSYQIVWDVPFANNYYAVSLGGTNYKNRVVASQTTTGIIVNTYNTADTLSAEISLMVIATGTQ